MIEWVLKKIFGTRNLREIKKLKVIVEKINEVEKEYQSLSEDAIRGKTGEFKARYLEGESLDDIMIEAYAVLKNACRRLVGTKFKVTENEFEWDMIPYDVQVLGGIFMFRGGITEMATGEGKTLVATLPLYLNAIAGKGGHLVTVNDYLAKRDSEWMKLLFNYLGLTVGCIQNYMSPNERRFQYNCDVTYGTNSEFGFDYLRDMGMASTKEDMVQREHAFAIVDEVDSILIDEARTPLIISGPVSVSTHRYDKLKPLLERLYKKQNTLCTQLIADAEKLLAKEDSSNDDFDDAILILFKVLIGMPKHKRLMRLLRDTEIRKALEKKESFIRSDNNRGLFQRVKETLYFSIDEKSSDVDLTEQGRKVMQPSDPDAFVIPDIGTEIAKIENDKSLSEKDKTDARTKIQAEFEEKSETIHNIDQLLKAYCLFQKDFHYVVQENKVMIVDEFTGRLMPGRRYSDGLHQALEAKENVEIEKETQTLASITIQNYFRMYDKLSGMTGTAETEATEFKDIYDADLLVVPTNEPCIRDEQPDRIFRTKREKYIAIIEEITSRHEKGQPVLVGTASVDVSEIISRMLRIAKIPHSVLNAKNHQKEAEIVAKAGQRGALTIATNMAGRGTDIKLGPGIEEMGGLHVIGSERHDARRIDRQLSGRCSRQGEAGSSRFYISLEDDLMRLFGSDRITSIMDKFGGLEEGEDISFGILSRSIQTAQKRVEQQNYSIRKRTLQFDDVMNKHREVIYGMRGDTLKTDEPREYLFDLVYQGIDNKLELFPPEGGSRNNFNKADFKNWLNQTFPLSISDEELEYEKPFDREALVNKLVNKVEDAYIIKEKYENSDELRWLEQHIILNAIDKLYQEHLYSMDSLRSGIQLRAYAQKDPLLEYKQEAYFLFGNLMDTIFDEILSNLFRSATNIESMRQMLGSLNLNLEHETIDEIEQFDNAQTESEQPEQPQQKKIKPVKRQQPKIGRNDPCPCGSGKKFKKCCGK
ncbi:MAG: preprotein translocase subunit SecA [Verrucomicrobiota bacterium]|nr:preprotein translocase subunit SecA [Verrucomicrobiota bacterium]